MSRFRNEKKDKFIRALSVKLSLEDRDNDLTTRCKFNFSYFDPSQDAGQKFSEWTHKQLYDLLGKIKDTPPSRLTTGDIKELATAV